ncbi:MAG: SLBB domain-containing protein [Chitinispirillia bacterium]|nr:SLBB domain-containing protein [Chitinispirillia bacterium]
MIHKRLTVTKFLSAIICTILCICFAAYSTTEFEREALRLGQDLSQIRELRESAQGEDTLRAPKTFRTQPSAAEIDLDSILAAGAVGAIESNTADVSPKASGTPQYFGYNLFSSTPDAFKPTAVGPIDPGYMIGPGDVLRLAVWGQSEFTHELTVNNDGKILIPVAGQFHVSGIPFEQLQSRLKNLLSRHYSGLGATPQRTFMDLSIAQLRPIRIYIMGEVRQPGGYTVSSFANAFSALYSVGGPLEKGSLRDVRVIRGDSVIAAVDIYDYLLTGRSKSDIRLQNNDVVFVPPRGKTVHISGAVRRPAIYELKNDEHLLGLLAFCGGVLSGANVDKAHLQRILPFSERGGAQQMTQKVSIELKRYLDGSSDFVLHDMDKIEVVSLFDDLRNFVTISGAVQYPGTYQSENMTLQDLVFKHARIIDNKTLGQRADLIRLNKDRVTTHIIPVNLFELHRGAGDMKMEPGDEVIIYDIEVSRPVDLQITIQGEVRAPGVYVLHSNMTLADAILSAGGFTRGALKTRFDVYRLDTTDAEKLISVYRAALPEGSASFIDENQRVFTLRDRDKIIVRPDPNYSQGRFVTLTGAVKYTGVYALETKTERFTSVIERAGGFQTDAHLNGIYITRNGRRLMVDSDAIYNKNRGNEDITLHDNDSIHIPRSPNTVLVLGEVNAPGLYGYVPGMRMRDYIDRAGGFTDSVNVILVSDPSGETRKIKKRSNAQVNDGTIILITKKPPKIERERHGPTPFEVIRDTLAIVTSAVTIIVLVTQLNK